MEDQISELTFGEEFANWIEDLAARFDAVPEPTPHLCDSWQQISERAGEILDLVSQEEWHPEAAGFGELYQQFGKDVDDFVVDLQSAAEPFGWIWEPLRLALACLAGEPLPTQAARLFQEAYERAYDGQLDDELQERVRKIMLWAQGHREVGLLELRDEVQSLELLLSELELPEASVPLSILDILKLLHRYPDDDNTDYREALDEALRSWEHELSSLLGLIGDNAVKLSDDIDLLLERCSETLETLESDPLSVAPADFENLCQDWRTHIPKLELFAETAAQRAGASLTHIDSMRRVSEDFRLGRCGLEAWTRELDEHLSRWEESEEEIRRTFSGDPDALNLIEVAKESLHALKRTHSAQDAGWYQALSGYTDALSRLQHLEERLADV